MSRTAKDVRFWNRVARKYAAGPIADVAGYERTLVRTRDYLSEGHAVLEIGCGTATTALKLAPAVARYVASDLSAEMIAIAREKAKGEAGRVPEFEVAAPGSAAWPEGTFDVVLAFNVLHLMPGRQAAFAEIHRVLRAGGHFISKTPCLKEMNPLIRLAIPVMQLFGKAPSVAIFSAGELERDLEAAGFEIVERARHGSHRKDARPFLVARKL